MRSELLHAGPCNSERDERRCATLNTKISYRIKHQNKYRECTELPPSRKMQPQLSGCRLGPVARVQKVVQLVHTHTTHHLQHALPSEVGSTQLGERQMWGDEFVCKMIDVVQNSAPVRKAAALRRACRWANWWDLPLHAGVGARLSGARRVKREEKSSPPIK